jgi:hypothetical protein
VQGRPFKVAGGDVKPAIVLLRHIENNYSISIGLVDEVRACERFSFVGAGLLAMDLQAPRPFQDKCVIVHDHRQHAGSYRGARSLEISSAVMFDVRLVS